MMVEANLGVTELEILSKRCEAVADALSAIVIDLENLEGKGKTAAQKDPGPFKTVTWDGEHVAAGLHTIAKNLGQAATAKEFGLENSITKRVVDQLVTEQGERGNDNDA